MPEITLALTGASFFAGILMFLAPCTLPLLPAYLAFISGTNQSEVQAGKNHRQVIINGLAFVIGFSLIFVVFGVLAGYFGSLAGSFRSFLTQLGGAFIILFGLIMLNVIKFKPLTTEHKFQLPKAVTPGEPSSALLIGGIFALGWTPCVGPVLASVLLLATTSSTALSGGLLLLVFSAGLAIPFMLTAVLYAKSSSLIKNYSHVSIMISRVGGIFLILLGTLLLTNNFGITLEYGYRIFDALGLNGLFLNF